MLINQWNTLVIPDDLVVFAHADWRLVNNPALAAWVKLTVWEYQILTALVQRCPATTVVHQLMEQFTESSAAATLRLQKTLGLLLLKWIIYVPEHIPDVPTPQPQLRQVYYAITDGCNLRCPYCYASSEHAVPHELTPTEAIHLVDQVADLGCETFILTGGEALLRHDLFAVAAHARTRGMRVNMITNGTVIKTPTIAERIAAHFDLVTMSMDGGTAAVHEQTRGTGTFAGVLRALDLLNAAGVAPVVNHVVTSHNVAYLHTLAESLAPYTVQKVRLMYQGPLGRGHRATPLSWADYLQVEHFVWGTPQARAMLPDRPKPPKPGVIKGNCGIGGTEIYINSVGDVYPCKLVTNPTFKAGNIREHSIRSIYTHTPLFQDLRTMSTPQLRGCETCYIRGTCGGGCRAFHIGYSGDLYVSASAEWCPTLRHQMVSAMWAAHGVTTVPVRAETQHAYDPILVKTGAPYPVPQTTPAAPASIIPLHPR